MNATSNVARVRPYHFARFAAEHRPITMLTSYDALTAAIFDGAGIDALLVGDSIGNNVFGYSSTVPVRLGQIADATAAVAGAAHRALVVADLPFGSYEADDAQAVHSAVALVKAGADAVKLEGGARVASRIRAIVDAGIPVIGHLGFTPQSEVALGGPRVQGRDDASREALHADAIAVQEAGAFALVLELVTAEAATALTDALDIATIGIGSGDGTNGQVLVWTDFAGLTTGRVPRFVKRYADLAGQLQNAAEAYIEDVRSGAFPAEEHQY